MNKPSDLIRNGARLIGSAGRITVFTGAGISVESGIPPFRGTGGLWEKYDQRVLDIDYFHRSPEKAWPVIKEIFFDFMGSAQPNPAHLLLAEMEDFGLLATIITQNIDGLHQKAGNTRVYEFHGTTSRFICTECRVPVPTANLLLSDSPPRCGSCGGLLKPDFIFFGEAIPEEALSGSLEETALSDLFLVIGTTGEVMPAGMIPFEAKSNGARIIEINPEPSKFTPQITDIFLQGKASEILAELGQLLHFC